MTTRTPMAVQQRQAQRSLSSSSLSTQRTFSQHHLPASPARKDALADLSADPPDAPPSRHGTNTPRRGGSRLRLELSNDHVGPAQLSAESPQSLASAPTRALSAADGLDAANSPALSRASHQESDNPPMPMPRRHKLAPRRPPHRRDASPVPLAAKKDGRPKAYTVDVPPEAPSLARTSRGGPAARDQFGKGVFSGYADFTPWTGKHREDEWSSESISKGVWEKYSSAESSSARLALLPALKQKNGLNALSTIFMGVLNQRRQRGQITTPSTFKPPPRVTLTDTKREVWLKDLANPATSLRRLSRTIPHGIRGRVLLDQCLNKNVPTERAVWLAKCVGANEIRAFKRKGANGAVVLGGEAKWCKDWTVFVEQFVDSVVSSVDEDGWKSKVTYAIRLATNLYSEHLLDRDHYLDWVISGLENSAQARLPMWILIAQIYWVDLLRSRKYGLRLVSAVLSHVHIIYNDPDRDILLQMSDQLSMMLTSLVKNNPESFVQPSSWIKYRDSLKATLPVDDEASQRAYHDINSRNMRLASAGNSYPPAGRQKLVRLLDSTFQSAVEADLATRCWAATDDKTQLVRTVVEWATSMHRSGVSRVYVAATMLKTFNDWSPPQSLDATTAVLGTLDGISPRDHGRKSLIYHLVAELIRGGVFSVPRYLQWLISRGGLHDAMEIDPEQGPCATRLLVEIPVDSFQGRLKTDRENLLRRAGNYSVASEEEDVSTALRCVQQTLGLHLPPEDPLSERKPMPLRKLLSRIRSSSRALKYAVGGQLRGIMAQQGMGSSTSNPTALGMFVSVRTILEDTGDFAVLSDIIQSCLKSSDADILAACVDTVNANLAVFAALGLAAEYFGIFVERLRSFGQQGPSPHPLLAAVAHLAQRMPGREDIASQLRQELLQRDRSNALDACSPVSDSMALQAQAGEGDLSEEVDKLLASGTRIDHPTMNRLFRTILPRLEAGWAKGDDSRRVYASLLTKMRVFDAQHFDKLIADWVSHVRSLPARPSLADLFPMLVTMGCLTVPALLHTANASPPMTSSLSTASAGSENGGCATYLQELLALLLVKLPKSTGLGEEEAYRFGIHQRAAKLSNVPAFLTLARNSMVEYSALRDQVPELKLALDDPPVWEAVLDALKVLVVTDPPAASEALCSRDLTAGAARMLSRVTTKLLLPDEDEDAHVSFDYILGLATELTLPFCQIKLEFDLSVSEANPGADENPAQSRFDLFANAMDRAIEANNITWTSMLPCLSGDISQHLKCQAHSRFLSLVPSLKSPNLAEATSKDTIHLGENLVGVIEAITTGQPSPKSTQLSHELVEKLCDLCEIVASRKQEVDDVRVAVINNWLPALLRVIIIQGGGVSDAAMTPPASTGGVSGKVPTPPNHETRARVIISLCSMLLELQLLPPRAVGDLAERVFDVAMLLVDTLPEDMRLQCARMILVLPGTPAAATNLSSDPKLRYLLGTPQPTAADSLALSHRDKSSPAQGAVPRSMGAMYGIGPQVQEKLTPFAMRRWEMLSESTPNIGENDTSLSLGLFEAIKIQ